MTLYGAYTEIPGHFLSFEAALEHLRTYPGAQDKVPVSITSITETGAQGASGERLTGLDVEYDERTREAFLVKVYYQPTPGAVLKMRYVIEVAKEVEQSGENDELGDEDEFGPGGEEGAPGLDEGPEPPSESDEEDRGDA